eukprot:TRINITY_DN993_c0_g1_i2.p1 TRINITY_DN993_c0_g1~~TRINITY_DN993_c0_g1_i2.p1  ORF type:complete len:416 (-),score=127.12 TRINITY_DN993_c0_g1_i2:115-1362(-)
MLLSMKPLTNSMKFASSLFKSSHLQKALTFQNMYLGLSPYDAPSTFSLLQYTEYADGVWYSMGGMHKIADALRQVCEENGVNFVLNTSVTKINIDATTNLATGVTVKASPPLLTPSSSVTSSQGKKGKVETKAVRRSTRGKKKDESEEIVSESEGESVSESISASSVVGDGEEKDIESDVVLCNADLAWAYGNLLPNKRDAKKIEKMGYTSSTIMFYWSIDKVFPQIKHHNVFLSGDYKKSFTTIFQKHQLPDDPSFYANAPARTDPSAAPEGCDSIMVLVPTGVIDGDANSKQDFPALVKRARASVLKRFKALGMVDFEKHIVHEVTYNPETWAERYNLMKGATFGLSHDFFQIGYLRPANKHDRYSNVYFAGASTHPGGGMPLVLLGGRLAAERVQEARELLPYEKAVLDFFS